MSASNAGPPLRLDQVRELFARRAANLRAGVVEVLGFSVHVREVPARLRVELEDALGERGRFEGMPWHERVAFVLSLTVVDPETREPLLAPPGAPLDDGEAVDAAAFVGELPPGAVVELYAKVCELNRLGREGVDAAAGESEAGPTGGASSGSA